MRHKKTHGITYSVFPFGSAKQMFLAGEPEELSADLPQQIRSLLEQCKNVCEKEGFIEDVANMAVMGHIFLANLGMKELFRQLADEVFPELSGVLTFVPQVPASGAGVAFEFWVIDTEDYDYASAGSQSFIAAEFGNMRWLFIGDCRPEGECIGAFERAKDAFGEMGAAFISFDFQYEQLVRTWIFQGNLLAPEKDSQRYKELNAARTDCFEGKKFLKKHLPKDFKGTAYPASTGIGADDYDVVMSAVALDTRRKDVITVPLENPNQTSAFDYGSEYSPESPKFSRAMAVAVADECLIFVSGTASITDSESRHLEDPVKQTEQTLDNIAALISSENLAASGIAGMECGLDNLESVRVYVKRPAELELIRKVCKSRLPDVPTVYTIADVCRPELLVEIEGIALTRREG